jgi:hypothetical protein
MTTLAHCADRPGALALNVEDDVSRSAAVVQASGYRLVPITHPIGPWAILAVCSQGLLLVGVVREAWPSTMGGLWGHPASFPVNTRRLIHKWAPDAPLPETLTL